jgi:hypothetical protein
VEGSVRVKGRGVALVPDARSARSQCQFSGCMIRRF